MKVSHVDHIVLTVKDVEASARFYENVLGMERMIFGEGRVALKFGRQKINLHEYGNEFEPHADVPQPGSADLCFVIAMPVEGAMEYVKSQGVGIVEGPVQRTGATGALNSFYIRDPDSNLIELSNEI